MRPKPSFIQNYPSSELDFRNQPKSKLNKGFRVTEAEISLLKDIKHSFSIHLKREVTDSELIRNMIDFCIINDDYFFGGIKFVKAPKTVEETEDNIIENKELNTENTENSTETT
jgi:hypothetical protein